MTGTSHILAVMYLSAFKYSLCDTVYCEVLYFQPAIFYFFFCDETIRSSCIFSRECYFLTSTDPVYPDLEGTLGCSVWERWWAHCGQACGLIVGTLVGTLWASLWAHCGNAGGHIVGTLVGTLWARLGSEFGHACRHIVGMLVGTLWARFAVFLEQSQQ